MPRSPRSPRPSTPAKVARPRKTADPVAHPSAATVSLREAAEYLGISQRMAYTLVRDDHFPVPVLRVGSLLKVSRAALEQFVANGVAM